MPVCYQINLQTSPGGGEIYTRFLTEALGRCGWQSVLIVSEKAAFWDDLQPGGRLVKIPDGTHLTAALPQLPSVIVTHNVLGADLAAALAARHQLAGVIHMPFFERDLAGLPSYGRLFAVSQHVRSSLLARGLSGNVHDEPLYGVADLRPRDALTRHQLASASIYEWDRRKFRDRLLAACERLTGSSHTSVPYTPTDGITIGIVSRFTPIKQFPLMFASLAPLIADEPRIHLDLFGSGGYASVRDLQRALRPIRNRVRFWGQQSDVRAAYDQVDYVLSGLPEKEALGLNLIEAQMAGTPVLAVNAPPFTETVLDGVTGHLFEDPRHDAGAGFARLLQRIASQSAPLDDTGASKHLARFSMESFTERVSKALQSLTVPKA